MKQLNEVKRMQELAGLTKEAPAMPPVPGKSSSSTHQSHG